jgi:FAD/FMN-containing dehydrogenase
LIATPSGVIRDLSAIVGEIGVLLPTPANCRYELGYRYGAGRARAIVRPATVAELTAVMRYCFAQDLQFIAQGANTGLVGASTPDTSGEQLVLSLERLHGVESFDVHNRTVCALAGTRLSDLNTHVQPKGLRFPIDLGADPSLGGMVATNTGGSRLIRYGDVRKNLLGLEVVLADRDATVISDLTGLRKDNSGIDLKQLFVGTSGSFGVIVRVQVELHQLPAQTATALVVPTEHAAIPPLISMFEARAGEFLAAFEGMSANALSAALAHNRRLRNPFGRDQIPDYITLVELSTSLPASRLNLSTMLTELLSDAMEDERALVTDARFGPGEDFWAIRHSVSDAIKSQGIVVGFDISVARSRLPALRTDLIAALRRECRQLKVCDFGHCGDGGDHFNLVWPHAAGPCDNSVLQRARDVVYDHVVNHFQGSFSAEHGVGPHNIEFYRRYTGRVERQLAGRLKQMCDPKGLLGRADFC